VNAEVLNLRQMGEVDPRSVFTGPLRSIRLVKLEPGQRAELSTTGVEHTLFTLDGSGEISSGGTGVPLKYGVSVTLPLGTETVITAGSRGMEYFLASLDVPGGGAR
jgi:mannose-6-phosphate isomerase-like protein (cupin superfamily)